MKKYNVTIRSITENNITVLATCKKEALNKVDDLIASTNLKKLDIDGQTKHSMYLKAVRIPIFQKK